MTSLKFYYGTMASGKTTAIMQMEYNLNAAFPGQVLLINKYDRSGENLCSSRIGNVTHAITIHSSTSIVDLVKQIEEQSNQKIKYLLADEVQFFSQSQIGEMAFLVDHHDIDVIACGLLSNYKGRLFPGSSRLIELADTIVPLKTEIRCWCGALATHNSLSHQTETMRSNLSGDSLSYEVVCRKHFYEVFKSRNLDSNGYGVSID